MRILDRVLAGLLVLLGCVHNFVAAPMTHHQLSTSALWFASAGLALWYAGFMNLLRAQSATPGRLLAWLCLATNVTMLAFVAGFATVERIWTSPASLLLVGAVAVLTATSLVSVSRAAPGLPASSCPPPARPRPSSPASRP